MELTRKAYSGLVTLLNGIFKYGKKLGYTSISISTFIKDLYLPKNIFKKNFKDKKKEVFMEDEIPVIVGYLRENTYNKRLNLICDKLNLAHRTTHKIRKTYGTTLLDNEVTDSFVAEQMGHTDVSTTRKLYYYSNKNYQTKIHQISEAIDF